MASKSLRHDCAWMAAREILNVFRPLLREEEHRDAFKEIYARVDAAIEYLCSHDERMHQRLNPSQN